MAVASKIPGVYWRVGQWGGRACFRQEPSSGVNCHGLFIFDSMADSHEGWWISSQPVGSSWSGGWKGDGGPENFAWGCHPKGKPKEPPV
eukprot:4777653-Karenia_brevis.AAC.1